MIIDLIDQTACMKKTTTKRRRRSPEEAREEILDAAEKILLTEGPSELKFQRLAKVAGISQSNVHHHFGGMREIESALITRILSDVSKDLSQVLVKFVQDDEKSRVGNAVDRLFEISTTERNMKVIAWLFLTSKGEHFDDTGAPLQLIQTVTVSYLEKIVGKERAEEITPIIFYQMAITAVGEGMVGEAARDALGPSGQNLTGKTLLVETIQRLLETP